MMPVNIVLWNKLPAFSIVVVPAPFSPVQVTKRLRGFTREGDGVIYEDVHWGAARFPGLASSRVCLENLEV